VADGDERCRLHFLTEPGGPWAVQRMARLRTCHSPFPKYFRWLKSYRCFCFLARLFLTPGGHKPMFTTGPSCLGVPGLKVTSERTHFGRAEGPRFDSLGCSPLKADGAPGDRLHTSPYLPTARALLVPRTTRNKSGLSGLSVFTCGMSIYCLTIATCPPTFCAVAAERSASRNHLL